MAGFPSYVATFEERRAFPGPGLYFHERAIERRRTHDSVQGLLRDRCFLEYVYAVLPRVGYASDGATGCEGRGIRAHRRGSP
jgi:hypothetical protein